VRCKQGAAKTVLRPEDAWPKALCRGFLTPAKPAFSCPKIEAARRNRLNCAPMNQPNNQPKRKFQSPRGTHDILPEDIAVWRAIENTFRTVCERANYREIRTPDFEATELFARSAGASSDVLVTKQMYSFVAPDEQSYTLRPEGTAPVVRAYLEHNLNERGPVCKLFYCGPFFRYEAPQAGRFRQFHQCGLELLGAPGAQADVEVLSVAYQWLRELQIPCVLKINTLGTLESRRGYLQTLREYLEPRRTELSPDSQKRLDVNALRVFDSKDERDHKVLSDAPRLLDYLRANDAESTEHFTQVCAHLDELEIAYEIDSNLVRGFDYYTHTAFEFVSDSLGAQNTVLGGGRYNGLVEELGGPPTSGIGFGAGMERLREAMQLEVTPIAPPTAFLICLGDAARAAAPKVLWTLRKNGIAGDCDFVGRSMRAQMREANRQNARFALILGEDELARGEIADKNMESGEQSTLSVDEAIRTLVQG